MPNLYIVAGCNGAGKTTASFPVSASVHARALCSFAPPVVRQIYHGGHREHRGFTKRCRSPTVVLLLAKQTPLSLRDLKREGLFISIGGFRLQAKALPITDKVKPQHHSIEHHSIEHLYEHCIGHPDSKVLSCNDYYSKPLLITIRRKPSQK